MAEPAWQALPARKRGRASTLAALLSVAFAGLWASHGDLSFMSGASPLIAPVPFGGWLASRPTDRMQTPRGEVVPRTQLRGRYKDGNRSGQNHQGGGRKPMCINRRASFAYASKRLPTGEVNTENTGSLLRRCWDMYDVEYNLMIGNRQRFHRTEREMKRFCADFMMQRGSRRCKRRMKQQLEEGWLNWMKVNGAKAGLLKPIIFDGPLLKWTPEEEEEQAKFKLETRIDITRVCNPRGRKVFLAYERRLRKEGKFKKKVPCRETLPGQWNGDSPENIFKIWRRPLHKYAFDVSLNCLGKCVRRSIVW